MTAADQRELRTAHDPPSERGLPGDGLLEQVPHLRGWLHAAATPVVLVAGVVLLLLSPDATTRTGAAVFTACTLSNFAVSTAMHLGHWGPSAARVVRRVDHACVFISIAGSYTPFTLLVLSGRHRAVLLSAVWTGAALGVGFRLTWTAAPRWLVTSICVALGWAGLVFVPEFARFTPVPVPALLGGGLALYTAGGLVYALRRPDPVPAWFGFHEVFHALSITGFAAHYAALLVATCARR